MKDKQKPMSLVKFLAINIILFVVLLEFVEWAVDDGIHRAPKSNVSQFKR